MSQAFFNNNNTNKQEAVLTSNNKFCGAHIQEALQMQIWNIAHENLCNKELPSGTLMPTWIPQSKS